MDNPSTKAAFKQLAQSLDRLAAPAAEQITTLHSLRIDVADELALEFDDVVRAVVPVLEQQDGTEALRNILTDLDAKLDSMSGEAHKALWELDALHVSEEWVEVRTMAGNALRQLPEILEKLRP